MISSRTVLIVSQDYELFFHRSGTIDKCLLEPCDALLKSAATHGYRITFYVDAGMLVGLARFARQYRGLISELDRIRAHLGTLVAAGHDIGLHVHPHWEDARFDGSAWDFAATRYRLADFTQSEAAEIVRAYSKVLGEACGVAPTTYRAGGFCIEPFDWIADALAGAGIDVDSSVVPGAHLRDGAKGFDFRSAPATDWWRFSRSPTEPGEDGRFLEIPVTPQRLPMAYYWRRLAGRLTPGQPGATFGDGSAKKIGRREVLRRLAGMSRIAEASIDDPKADELESVAGRSRGKLFHVMGHPKNLSRRSLQLFEALLASHELERFEHVASAGRLIRGGGLG